MVMQAALRRPPAREAEPVNRREQLAVFNPLTNRRAKK